MNRLARLLTTVLSGGAAVVSNIFSDTFAGTNGTNLTAHTPDVAPAGSWVAGSGTIVITSNQANIGVSSAARYAFDVGAADYTLTCHVDPINTGGSGVIVRYTDVNNFWMARWGHLSTNKVQLFKFEAGTPTEMASAAKTPTVNGEPYDITIVCSDETIQVTVGATIVTYASATFQKTATKVGLYGSNTSEFWDDLVVSPL